MKNLKKYISALAVFAFISLPAAAFSGRKIDGIVLDEGSGQPVPDAFVVVVWGGFAGITHGERICYHVEATKTDNIGRFQTKSWSTAFAMQQLLVTDRKVFAVAFKPGYVYKINARLEESKVVLRKFNGTSDQYFANLRSTLMQDSLCFSQAATDTRLYPIFTSVVTDTSSKAKTAEDLNIVSFFELLRDEALSKSLGVKK